MNIKSGVAPDDGVVPLETKMVEAVALQTALAASKLCLFKAGVIALTAITTKELMDSEECDFDGYTPGGVTIAAFGEPFADENGESVLLVAPSKQFNYVDGVDHVSNEVGGAYLVDAGGKLRGVIEFDAPVTLNNDNASLVVLFSRRV